VNIATPPPIEKDISTPVGRLRRGHLPDLDIRWMESSNWFVPTATEPFGARGRGSRPETRLVFDDQRRYPCASPMQADSVARPAWLDRRARADGPQIDEVPVHSQSSSSESGFYGSGSVRHARLVPPGHGKFGQTQAKG
jgi:hypothetical protein